MEKSERDTIQFVLDQQSEPIEVEEAIAMVLEYGKYFGNKYAHLQDPSLDEDITDAVISVPSYFSVEHRELLKQSASMAGLQLQAIITDLEAVAIDYSQRGHLKEGETHKVIFYDIGTDSATASLIQLSKQQSSVDIQVLATDTQHVGGFAFDIILAKHLAKEFDALHLGDSGESVLNSKKSMIKLLSEVNNAKEVLSASNFVDIEIENLNGVEFRTSLTRETLETLTKDLYPELVKPIGNVLQKSGLKEEEILSIELFGGGVRIPKLQATVQQNWKIPLGRHINGDEAAVFGSCHYAAVIKQESFAEVITLHPTSEKPSSGIILTPQQLERSFQKLKNWNDKEKKRQEAISAKNDLESFVVDGKDKVDLVASKKSMTAQKEAQQLREHFAEVSAWLDDNFELLPPEEYSTRLEELKSKVEPIFKKYIGRKDEL